MSTTYTVRPFTEISRIANLGGGPADSAAATNDNSDSTYVQLYSGGASYFLDQVGYPSLAGNEIILQVRLNIRMRSTGVGGMNTYTFLENNVGQQCAPDYYSANYSSYTTLIGDWKNTAPDGGAWTDVKLTQLRVRVADNGAATTLPQVAEVYVDIVTNKTPVVSSVLPTTNQVTSRPTISWTYTDADTDPQAKFRVRIFSEAQYSAGGFDPNTSTPTIDSSDVYSSTHSWTVTSDLQNGTRYAAFVQAADGITGVYSLLSTMGPYGAFNVVIVPPAVPELTITSDNVGKRNQLTLQDRESLLSTANADVETSLGGWSVDYNAATVTRSTDYANNGAYSVKMIAVADSTGSYTSVITSDFIQITVVPSRQYSMVAYLYKNSGTARKIQISIYWYDVTNTFITASDGIDVTQRIGEWTPVFATGVAPTNAYLAKVVVRGHDMLAAEVMYIDTVSMVPFALNMLDNPIFEQDSDSDGLADDWIAYNFGTGATPTYVLDLAAGNYVAGNKAQKMTWSGNSGNKGIATARYIPVKNGVTYTISAWVMASSASAVVGVYHAGLNGGTGVTTTITTANTWQRVTFTVTASATTSSSLLYIYGTAAALTLWVGQVQMEIGSSASNEVCNRKPWIRGGLLLLQRFQVHRSYDQTTWTDITSRLTYDPSLILENSVLTSVNVSDSLQSLIVYDYDVQLAKTVYYQVRNVALADGNNLTSQWSMVKTVANTALTPDPLLWQVKVPQKPSLNVALGFKGTENDGAGWKRRSSEAAAFFQPISRTRKVKVRDVIYGDEFTLIVSITSSADATAMTAIRNSQLPLLLQATDGRQWFVDMDNSVDFNEIVTNAASPYEEINIQFIEVDAPYA